MTRPTTRGVSSRWRSTLRRLGVSDRDSLTGLRGRDALATGAAAVFDDATADGRPVVLLLLDLDGFKALNDTAGHHTGDRLLVEVARRLTALRREGDLLVRLGGDEFAMLLGSLRRGETGAERAEAVIDAVSEPFDVDDLVVSVRGSVGLAVLGTDGSSLEELLRAADQAMYAAKEAGSGRWRSSSPALRGGTTERLLRDLRAGAARHVTVHYQPQVHLTRGDVVGFEALARLAHPDLGLLQARDFIPLAERSGLMPQVTQAVLDRSISDRALLLRAAPEVRLSINVTRRLILARGLVDSLLDQLDRHGVPRDHLLVEITETLTHGSREVQELFRRLNERGVGVSIHGFGASRSSLTALWSNPAVREIKIAPSIVRRAGDDAEAARLVRGLTHAAHGLDIDVVAEGVEDLASARLMRDLGCDLGQGFWIGPPTDGVGAEAWVRAWPGSARERLGLDGG